MEPAIPVGSIVQVDTPYPPRLLAPGDIVTLQRGAEYDVKRIIAVPGHTVDYEVGWLTVDGAKIAWVGGNFPFKGRLRYDQFFVIGDNLSISLDSRFLGPVKGDSICGKVSRIDS